MTSVWVSSSENRTPNIFHCHLLYMTTCSIWLSFFLARESKLWPHDVLENQIFDFANFAVLTTPSLLLFCRISFPIVDVKLSYLLTVHRNVVTEFWCGSSVAYLLVFKNCLCLGKWDEHFTAWHCDSFINATLHFSYFFHKIVENNELFANRHK